MVRAPLIRNRASVAVALAWASVLSLGARSALGAASPPAAGAAFATAAAVLEESLSPTQIKIGESAQLTIKSSGTDMQPPTLPVVAGLEFRVIERLQGIELIHGATLATSTTVVQVTPQIAGTFIIPEISPRSPPLTLRVSPVNIDGGSSPVQRAVRSGAEADGIHLTPDGAAFIKLSVSRRDVYVGESVPLAIEVGMRGGVVTSLNGLPTLGGSDFTLNNLSRQPERKEQIIEGKPFIVLTWRSALAPVKAGSFSLSVEAPLTIRVSTRPRQEAMLEDQLGDPFMQRIFGATTQKNIKAASPPLELDVSALPAEGRPPDFSGAVGKFKISSDISSTAAAAGDPLTLRMHVEGSGNFDRVDSNMLEHVPDWKTYPPTSSFKPLDTVGVRGEKTFEQPVIASKSGAQTLPALTFTYFDPESRRYETARSPPIAVKISASAADSGPDVSSLAAAGSAALRPDRTGRGISASSLTPLYLQGRFLSIPSITSLLAAGFWWRRRRAGDAQPTHRRLFSAPSRRARAELDAAARAGDAPRFFRMARITLQQALAERWGLTPAEVTAAEVQARLGDEGNEICRLFTLADEASYAGRALGAADLSRWMQVVHRHALPEMSP